MNIADVSVRYDTAQKTLAFHIETDTDDTSVSDHYVNLQLPTSMSAAKTGIMAKSGSKVEVEVRYSDDLPYIGASVNVTAGSSADAVRVTATAEDGTVIEEAGTTGTAISMRIPIAGREAGEIHPSQLPPVDAPQPGQPGTTLVS